MKLFRVIAAGQQLDPTVHGQRGAYRFEVIEAGT
jgi:hypothetical protein